MVAKTTKILMINTFTGSASPNTGNQTQVLSMANGMNIIICRLLSFVWKKLLTSITLTFVISNRDQNVSNVITTIIVMVPRPALNDLWLIFLAYSCLVTLGPSHGYYFLQSTYVRISINWKWQQVAPMAQPIEIDTDINIIILSGKILDTKYIIYEEIFWYKGIQSWRNPSEKKDKV